MKPLITIELMLHDQLKNVYSPLATKLRLKLESNLNVAQSLVLHRIAINELVNGSEYHSARGHLLKNKYIYAIPGDTRGANGQIMKHYRMTDKGEIAALEIQNVYQPIVDRMNKSQEATAEA